MGTIFTRKIIILLILTLLFCSNSFLNGSTQDKSQKHLYPGEEIVFANNYPSLIKFINGNPNKPLVVFNPGFAFLARIAYGYPGGKQQDFLSFWLHKAGYPFLGVSYPLENPVYSKVYPSMGVTDWGKMVADITKKCIQKNGLTSRVIFLGWSMGGTVAAALNKAAIKNGLQVEMFVSIASLPPRPGIYSSNTTDFVTMAKNGLINIKPLNRLFLKDMELQNNINSHVIIPENIFLSQIVGNLPIGLMGTALRYKNGKWTKDLGEALKDSDSVNMWNFPLPAIVRNSGFHSAPDTTESSYFNTFDWGPIMVRKLFQMFRKSTKWENITDRQFSKIEFVSKTGPEHLTKSVYGTHFFFVGEQGAKNTARAISELDIIVQNYEFEAECYSKLSTK